MCQEFAYGEEEQSGVRARGTRAQGKGICKMRNTRAYLLVEGSDKERRMKRGWKSHLKEECPREGGGR